MILVSILQCTAASLLQNKHLKILATSCFFFLTTFFAAFLRLPIVNYARKARYLILQKARRFCSSVRAAVLLLAPSSTTTT